MLKIHKEYILRAMDAHKGDNLERANAAFGGMSEQQLEQQWGQSGMTCRAIWQQYKDQRELHKSAQKALNEIL